MTDAELLRAAVLDCSNCRTPMMESRHSDGIRLTCARCGFFATEAWARSMREKLSA